MRESANREDRLQTPARLRAASTTASICLVQVGKNVEESRSRLPIAKEAELILSRKRILLVRRFFFPSTRDLVLLTAGLHLHVFFESVTVSFLAGVARENHK